MAEKSQASELADLVSRQAAADLVHTYAKFVRTDHMELVPGLFTQDGVFEMRDGHPSKPEFSVRMRIEGQEHLKTFYGPSTGNPHPVPLVHNIIVEADGDTAKGTCVMEGQIYGTKQRVYGEYHDDFRKVNGKWLFASRVFTMFTAEASI